MRKRSRSAESCFFATAAASCRRCSPTSRRIIGAAGGYGLYRRFGFIYAAIAAGICLAAIPFAYELPAALQRVIAAAIAASVLVGARAPRLKLRDDYPGDEYGVLQATALAGVYAAVNIQIGPARYAVAGWLYWFSYVLTWIVPLAAVRVGIRDRDRELMDVGLALTLVTLLTNKSYFGWARNTSGSDRVRQFP